MTRSLDDISPTDTDSVNHTHTVTDSSHSLHQNRSSLDNSTHLLNQTTVQQAKPGSQDELADTESDITGENEDTRIVGGQLQGQGGSPWQVGQI